MNVSQYNKKNVLVRSIVFVLDHVWLFAFLAFLFALALTHTVLPAGEQQFSYLAQSFLHGRLFFLEQPGSWADTALFQGHYYWPLGPFPAIFILPFVLLWNMTGHFFYQGYALFFITLAVFFIWYSIARHRTFSARDSLIIAASFCFGSGYILAASSQWSWYFAQAVAVLLLSAALLEHGTRKRYWVIGILMALVTATRITVGVGALFFVLEAFFNSEESFRRRARNAFFILVPMALVFIVLAFYNYARFGNFFEQGYIFQQLAFEPIKKACSYGIISVMHIPANVYYLFFSSPSPVFLDSLSRVLTFPYIKPDPWGMSIFITSPYLVILLFSRLSTRTSKLLTLTIGCMLIPILLYCGIGYRQYGYRYALDFFPLLFLLFIAEYSLKRGELSRMMRVVLFGSICINVYLFSVFLLAR